MKREEVTLMNARQRVTGAQWRVLILLVLSNGINFLYRANSAR